MRKLILAAASCFALFVLALPAMAPVSAASCRIGKPSYCFKYGGFRCEKKNNASFPVAACTAWRKACIACHVDAPPCLQDETIHADATARCGSCREVWSKCMIMIDARYYPNRQSK